ncbi:MAG: hypothetical protein K8S27_07355 [Candidatus Omnitrophica bacterium]|nr:hypothetical protein [Candidatus Omnitrophota bacterium]
MKRRTKQTIILYSVAFVGVTLTLWIGWLWGRERLFYKYSDIEYGLSVKYPARWKLVTNPSGSTAVVFVSPLENDLDFFRENVNITVQDISKMNITSLNDYSTMIIQQLQMGLYKFIDIQESKEFFMANLPAYQIIFIGKDPDVTYKLMIAWTIKGKHAFQFTFIALESKYDLYMKKVETMMDSVRIK